MIYTPSMVLTLQLRKKHAEDELRGMAARIMIERYENDSEIEYLKKQLVSKERELAAVIAEDLKISHLSKSNKSYLVRKRNQLKNDEKAVEKANKKLIKNHDDIEQENEKLKNQLSNAKKLKNEACKANRGLKAEVTKRNNEATNNRTMREALADQVDDLKTHIEFQNDFISRFSEEHLEKFNNTRESLKQGQCLDDDYDKKGGVISDGSSSRLIRCLGMKGQQ
mmetsp:Transcript_24400/g.28726  ORF Transcript_24400/g.28726 Transcript_24400/m.28726 type:complete len:224 (+) Transcript_24400:276-947(+)